MFQVLLVAHRAGYEHPDDTVYYEKSIRTE